MVRTHLPVPTKVLFKNNQNLTWGPVAQPGPEQGTSNPLAGGSNPPGPTNPHKPKRACHKDMPFVFFGGDKIKKGIGWCRRHSSRRYHGGVYADQPYFIFIT